MPRYEHAGRFWTIVRTEAVLTITHGKLGNKGRTSTQHFASPAKAKGAQDALVIARQHEGYRLTDDPTPGIPAAPVTQPEPGDERGADLEAAILEDPEDAAAYAVYGDWLQRHGDPRGELIALQRAAAAEPPPARPRTSSPRRAAVGKHLARHADVLLGELAGLVADVRDPAAPPFIWRNGFIHRAVLGSERGRDLADELARLFAHPSGRFLVELAVRADGLDEAADALATLERAAPPTLRELDLFARAALEDLGTVWPRVAGLRRLTIAARAFELGRLELPAVQRARFLAGRMRAGAVRAIAEAPWPALERLELRFCGHVGSADCDFEDLRPLLSRTDLPALTHLKLRGAPFAGAIMRALTRAPLARQLHVLDLSAGNISPADIAILADHAGAFPQLRELWMPYDRLTARHQDSLRGVATHVISDTRAPIDTLDEDLSGQGPAAGEGRAGGSRA